MASTDSAPRAARRKPRRTDSQEPATARDASPLRRPNSPASWLLGLFIVLAVVASVVMVVAKDGITVAGTVAVIAALWAAVIGAVLVAKYRRQADVAESRNRDQRLVYELQLEHEIAARRQYEAEVETAVRAELAAETNAEFEALKNQVLALRASLEKVLGNPLPEVPLALRPERRRELGSGLSGVAYAVSTDDRVAADLDFQSTATPSDAGRHAPLDVEVVAEEQSSGVEMTELIPVITEDPAAEHQNAEYREAEYQEAEYQAAAYGEAEYGEAAYGEAEYGEAEYGEAAYEDTSYEDTSYEDMSYEDASAADYGPAGGYTPPRYGRPQYGESQYGQPQYGEPQYGQPQYGRPQHGRPQYADPRYAAAGYTPPQPVVDEYPVAGHAPAAYDASAYQPPGSGPVVPPVPEVPPMPRPRRGAVDDGAHTGGQPVSELLNRLREDRGSAGGGRRRRD